MVRMSYSSTREFLACPSRFYRRKIQGEEGEAPPVYAYIYGSASHRKLEKFIEHAVAENFIPRDKEELMMKLAEHMTDKQSGLCPGIAKLFMGVYEKYGKLPKFDVELKLDWSENLEHEFLGFVDCVINDSIIIDFKTGVIDEDYLEGYKLQLGLYAKFYELMYGKKIEKIMIWSLRGGDVYEFDANEMKEKSYEWYMTARKDVQDRLATGKEFETKKDEDNCSDCPFKRNCKAWSVG